MRHQSTTPLPTCRDWPAAVQLGQHLHALLQRPLPHQDGPAAPAARALPHSSQDHPLTGWACQGGQLEAELHSESPAAGCLTSTVHKHANPTKGTTPAWWLRTPCS